MIRDFSFNSDTHDFWDIYETIKRFYPIGIPRLEGSCIYNEYKGIKELEKIIIDNLHNAENFKNRWVTFTDQLASDFNCEVIGTTYGQAPSISATLILEKNEFNDCVHRKELSFSISLIGKFYQIYGADTTTVAYSKEGNRYQAINLITTSPYQEFKEPFQRLENKIKKKCKGYKLVPFGLCQKTIKGLTVRDVDNATVNEALFNHFLSGNIPRSTKGDKFYGYEAWKK